MQPLDKCPYERWHLICTGELGFMWDNCALESILTTVDLRVDHQMQFLSLKVCVNTLVLVVSLCRRIYADCWHMWVCFVAWNVFQWRNQLWSCQALFCREPHGHVNWQLLSLSWLLLNIVNRDQVLNKFILLRQLVCAFHCVVMFEAKQLCALHLFVFAEVFVVNTMSDIVEPFLPVRHVRIWISVFPVSKFSLITHTARLLNVSKLLLLL